MRDDSETEPTQGGWWGSTRNGASDRTTSSAAGRKRRRDAAQPFDPQHGVAWLCWGEFSFHRAQDPEHADTLPPDGYSCSLQPFDGHPAPVEEGPEGVPYEEALGWARARTMYILMRPQWDPGHTYEVSEAGPGKWRRID